MDPVADLAAVVHEAASGLVDGDVAPPQLERPPKAELGDYSTNAAMMLTRSLSRPPREIAEQLGAALADRLGDHLERVEVAGPGFLNLFMSDAWYAGVVAAVAGADDYGRGDQGARVNVEFVSANPTGPITVASARHAAYGDSLARVLELAGNDVDREYYVNDYGTQIQRFGQSLSARSRGQQPPEDGYQGEYVTELAARIDGAADMDPEELGRRGVELMLEGIEATLGRFGVHMDRYARESATHEADAVQAAIEQLREAGHIYEQDGATWLRTTGFGDDKDRVLVRSTGEVTYFAADIPYHWTKHERGYDRSILVVGADHHGYQSRVTAAWEAMGGEAGASRW